MQKLKEEEARKKREMHGQLANQAAQLQKEAEELKGKALCEETQKRIEEYNSNISRIEEENAAITAAHEAALLEARPLAVAR